MVTDGCGIDVTYGMLQIKKNIEVKEKMLKIELLSCWDDFFCCALGRGRSFLSRLQLSCPLSPAPCSFQGSCSPMSTNTRHAKAVLSLQ
jgi:hypothetical protein